MKKIIFILTVLCLTGRLTGQIIKNEEICEFRQLGNLICSLSANKMYQNDTLIAVNVHFMGYDHRYPSLGEYITLYGGPADGFATFITEVEKFYNQEPGTSTTIGNTFISVEKYMGVKGVNIHDDKVSYTTLNIKIIKKIKEGFFKWYQENR